MNVNQYTNVSYEKVIKEVPVVTTTYKEVEELVKKEEQVYEVELTQEQLDVIVAICGNITGGGPTRRLTDSIWSGLQKYASNSGSVTMKTYHFEDYFRVKESSYKECGYIVTKEY